VTKRLLDEAYKQLLHVSALLDADRKKLCLELIHIVLLCFQKANEPELTNEVMAIFNAAAQNNFDYAKKLIDDILPKISKIQLQMAQEVKEEKPHLHLVNEIECHNCRQKIPKHSKFCGLCGAPQAHKKCPSCNNECPQWTKFCAKCGYKF
jgi:hypothetical protein